MPIPSPDDEIVELGPMTQVDDAASGSKTQMSKSAVAIVIGVLMFVVFLATVDGSIVTALPAIVNDLHSPSGYTWIASAYLLGLTTTLPVWGTLSDIWGRKPIILAANAAFAAGSLISALAPNMTVLLVGRVIQGTGGGGMLILVNIIISDLFDIRNRAKYLGYMSGTWALGASCGPLIGAAFAQDVTWRWCFYFNLPVVGTGFLLLTFFLKIHNPKTPLLKGLKSIDLLGTLTIMGSAIMILLGLQMGDVTYPWKSATIICLLIFGFLASAIFVLIEWKVAQNPAKKPIIPLRILTHRSSIMILFVCFLHGMVLVAPFFYLPLYFQTVLGATPILSGVYLLPLVLSTTLSAAVVGAITKKTGRVVQPMVLGMALSTLGFGLYGSFGSDTDWAKIIIYQLIVGFGLGPNTYTPVVALQRLVETKDVAAATSTLGFIRQLGSACSAVIGGVIIQSQVHGFLPEILSRFGETLGAGLSGANIFASTEFIKSLPPVEKGFIRELFTSSMEPMWYFYCAISGLGLIFTLFVDRKKLASAPSVDSAVEQAESQKSDKVLVVEGDMSAREAEKNNTIHIVSQ